MCVISIFFEADSNLEVLSSHMPILCQAPRTGSHQALSSENLVGKTCVEAIQTNYLTAVQGVLRRGASPSMGRRKSRKAFRRRWHLN